MTSWVIVFSASEQAVVKFNGLYPRYAVALKALPDIESESLAFRVSAPSGDVSRVVEVEVVGIVEKEQRGGRERDYTTVVAFILGM